MADAERFTVGAEVELREPIYGYEAGMRGKVVRANPAGSVLVRFESTGHALDIAANSLKAAEPRQLR